MEDLKLALLGFGNAGRAFAKLLVEKQEEIKEKYGRGIVATAVVTRSKGTVLNKRGVDLRKAWEDIEKTGRFADDTEGLCDLSSFDVIEKGEYDALCEMTPLDIFTGQPATDHIRAALKRRKHVVTANKGPVAWAFDQLSALARENGVGFFYETTVMDGTPVFNLAEHTLKLCRITEISGILNSTTNYILDEMAKGRAKEDIIREGKSLGFIEADPATDIDGYDAAAKVAALLNVLMKAGITPVDVERTGIGDITLKDIRDAEARGKVIKLLCRGFWEGGKIKASVKPVEVDMRGVLASAEGTTSVLSITTDLMGKLTVIEHDPGIRQTAYGILGDCLRVLEESV